MFKIFNMKTKKNILIDNYFNNLINDNNNKSLYSFNQKYLNQENTLLKLYGQVDIYSKNIKLLVISDTHNCLDEIEFSKFVAQHNNYDICLLLGDHSSNDISIILKYVDKNNIYGLLGNHDFNYLDEFNINNLNGNIINIKGTTLLGIQGSFKYKPIDFPSFTQKDSILFLNKKDKVDILVSHDSGFNNNMKNNSAHQGLFGITYYLFKNKVPYNIHGHIHDSFHKKLINGTEEISAYMYEFIELRKRHM